MSILLPNGAQARPGPKAKPAATWPFAKRQTPPGNGFGFIVSPTEDIRDSWRVDQLRPGSKEIWLVQMKNGDVWVVGVFHPNAKQSLHATTRTSTPTMPTITRVEQRPGVIRLTDAKGKRRLVRSGDPFALDNAAEAGR